MSISARITAVRHERDKHVLTLASTEKGTGPGRRILHIQRNQAYTPSVRDEVWGNAHEVVIGGHLFRRIMQMWDGIEQVL